MLLKGTLASLLLLLSASAFDLRPRQEATPVSSPYLRRPTAASSCFKYMCNTEETGIKMSNDTCIHYEDDVFYLQSCNHRKDGLTFCHKFSGPNFKDSVCEKPPVLPADPSYPGEMCQIDTDCKYGTCNSTSLRCIGIAQGERCELDGECDPGLFCTSNKCTAQQGLGQPCAFDFDCQNSLGCNKTSTFTGKCVELYSASNGEGVTDCVGGQSQICKSGTCEEVGFQNHGTCIKAITSSKSPPHICTRDSDCIGKSRGKVFQGQCKCGMNHDGNAYCTPFYGDTPGKNALFYWSQLAKSNATASCNTLRRYNYNCIRASGYKYANDVIRSNLYMLYYPQLQQNDDCIKDIYNSYYWGQDSARGLVMSVLLLALLAQ